MNIEKENVFTELGLQDCLVKNLLISNISEPKPIQEQAIPVMLKGRDVLGIAQTGSGKTLAFSLPILSQILTIGDKRCFKGARALILVPTRELAVQIEAAIRSFIKGLHLSTCLILGGMSRLKQAKRMESGVDILIATPGRLMDLVRARHVDLSQSRFFVLDEADRMLDMGFINDVRCIAKCLHEQHQTALFSATMPKEITMLADSLLNNPIKIQVVPQGTVAVQITQKLYCVLTSEKKSFLNKLLENPELISIIVFTRTKHGADSVTRCLKKMGHSVATIHGNKSQNARQNALKAFRKKDVRILVATDIAARGIDVPGISHVINYDLPDEAESYVHRIGRTGRNGASGDAITLFDENTEKSRLHAIERVIRMKLTRENISFDSAQFSENSFVREGNKKENHQKKSSLKSEDKKRSPASNGKIIRLHKGKLSSRYEKMREGIKRSRSLRSRKSKQQAS
ncbi:DEAD/DEAH box helicase [Bartonella ancashensis]|uniref:ATP-dependent RNA helicase RhlE n=1 Tax=Bartonella ancashensis TaxID=1318743 RepID=A0A0M4LGQ6_9HYPH|nr:DEAD/DEAH box helicase [Bartonella ancashensis]ALE03657.1 ATP-dependent RNA helicase RhlE [Bartonella ancashensis]